jgi:site-specific DNA recombinase
MNYFLYARKSTDVEDKQVLSIEAQLSELRALAKQENLEVTAEFIEKRTAKMPGRPVFNEMLTRIQHGEAQGIICWKLDRLARNPVDGGQISWFLQQETIKHIQTHDRSHLSKDNVLMMSVEFGMANQFIRDLSSNTIRGLRHKAKRGEFPSAAPMGYINDVRTKTIAVDRKKSKVIKSAFERYAEGNSRLEDISKFLFENNVKSLNGLQLHKDRVRFILSNPFYYGHFRYGGEIYEGKHTPLIEKRLFDKVQSVLIRRGHPQKANKEAKPLCGLLRCAECGCMITAEIQKGHTYYRCTKKSAARCSQPYIREELLAANISEILSEYAMAEDWADELLKLADEEEKEETKNSQAVVSGLREKIGDITRKIDRITDLYVEQDIDHETYITRKRELMSEKKSKEEIIAKSQRGQCVWLEPMKEWIKTASTLDEIAKNADLPSKKSSIQKISGSNPLLKNRSIVFTPIKPSDALRASRENFSENDLSIVLAGEEGFEPSHVASRGRCLTTWPLPIVAFRTPPFASRFAGCCGFRPPFLFPKLFVRFAH